jgi:hypothetical protein
MQVSKVDPQMDVESTLGQVNTRLGRSAETQLTRRDVHKSTGSRLTNIDSRITLLLDLRTFIRCTQRVVEALNSSQASVLGDCAEVSAFDPRVVVSDYAEADQGKSS